MKSRGFNLGSNQTWAPGIQKITYMYWRSALILPRTTSKPSRRMQAIMLQAGQSAVDYMYIGCM